MAEVPGDDNALFAIEVDLVDDYADTAAADSATITNQDDGAMAVSRTFQSESAFQAQKTGYEAKIDQGNLEAELVRAVPALLPRHRDPSGSDGTTTAAAAAAGEAGAGDGEDGLGNGEGGKRGDGKEVKLSKKETQLLGYTVGELYFLKRFQEVIGLCERVLAVCEMDAKTRAGVEKWMQRSRARATGQVGGG
ncbi:hypothetical protein KC340_g14886 [Hortaea werneckii]|nr:hypothetical protein KC342_g15218 [Hortaea werneckii]KAI7105021.1 hypothetical protein KC339_g4126 [Hortaea werneckii]KAI7202331.1 hypothetical protein KC365_g18517 [Hortaea werneckii]KAI7297516.1 hypothetical protein KC340_g14886 [Hortaea werneckii]KAI7365785.1 hypothetical protein KC328_g18587 [Hortaea werneckii]